MLAPWAMLRERVPDGGSETPPCISQALTPEGALLTGMGRPWFGGMISRTILNHRARRQLSPAAQTGPHCRSPVAGHVSGPQLLL